MAGYNSSIFAYGQTGAGKTYTMMGVMAATGEPPSDHVRGLALRRAASPLVLRAINGPCLSPRTRTLLRAAWPGAPSVRVPL